MCIRDSPDSSSASSVASVMSGRVRMTPPRGARVYVPEPTPVSYTHLRAHETVLDLVCRLLLEKKNNTKNKRKKTQKILEEEDEETKTNNTR